MKKIFTLLTALIMVCGLSFTAHAALIDRGGGLIYDDDLNITWLQDAGFRGLDTWIGAMDWADTLVYGGFDDWRLPTALNQNGSGPCVDFDCTGSEMGHLYYTEIENTVAGGLTNNGPFTNLQPYLYWFGTAEFVPYPVAWFFDFGHFGNGLQSAWEAREVSGYAWAVRDGDSLARNGNATVPKPATILLLGSGLVGLITCRKITRRRG